MRLSLILLVLVFPILPAHLAHAQSGIWEIYTYGNGDMLKGALDAIVAFSDLNNGGLTSAIKLVTLLALLNGLVAAGAGLLTGRSPFLLLPYTILIAGLLGSLSAIPATIILRDEIANTDDIIDHVPLPIAVIGSMTSTFGQKLTQKIEQAIQPVDIERFTLTGLGWGPRVIQATLKASPLDQTLLTDLDAFIRDCLIPDISQGYKTVQGVTSGKTVDDILGDTNPAIAILLPSQCNTLNFPLGCTPPPSGPDQRCPDAYSQSLNPRLTQAATDTDFLKTIAAQIGIPYSQVPSSIGDVHSQVLSISQDGLNLLKLRFVANQLLPSVQAYAAIGGQSAALTAWSLAEAQNQQVSSWLSTGMLLQQTLPVFHSALEFLFYAFLLFGIPIIVIRPKMLIDIGSTALWLQLWPLAYVFGNLFLYKQVEKISFMTDVDGLNLGLSYATTQPLQNTIQAAYAASGFPVMIGIIMIGGMIFGGGFALTKAVSMGPFGAGSGMGTGAALGNINIGNVNDGNISHNNLTENTVSRDNRTEQQTNIDRMHRQNVSGPLGSSTETSHGPEGNRSSVEQDYGTTKITTSQPDSDHPTTHAKTPFSEISSDKDKLHVKSQMTDATYSKAEEGSFQSQLNTATSKTSHEAEQTTQSTTSAVNHALNVSNQDGTRRDDAKTEGLQTTLREQYGAAIHKTLGSSDEFRNIRDQADAHAATGSLGAGGGVKFGAPGSALSAHIGVDGRNTITSTDGAGKRYDQTLTEKQSRDFNRQFAEETSHNEGLQHSLSELHAHTKDNQLGTSLNEMNQSQKSYNEAVTQENSVSGRLSHQGTTSESVRNDRFTQFAAQAYQEDTGRDLREDHNNRKDPDNQAAAIQYIDALGANLRDGDPATQKQWNQFSEAHPIAQTEAIKATIGVAEEGMSQPHPANAPPGADTEILAGTSTPTAPRMGAVSGQITRELQGAGARDEEIKDQAGHARYRTIGVPNASEMEKDQRKEEKTLVEGERNSGQQAAGVVREAGHQAVETGKTLGKEIKNTLFP